MTAAADLPVAQQERSRRTARRILDSGIELLRAGGPEALTIAAVSARAGVAGATVYRRFGDKDGLLSAIQQEFTRTVSGDFGRRLSVQRLSEDMTATDAVHLAVRGLTSTFEQHSDLLQIFSLLGLRDAGILAEGSRASQQGGEMFRALLRPFWREFTHADVELALDVAHRIVYSGCSHRVLHGEHMESPRDLSWDQWAAGLERAVRAYLLAEDPRT